MQMRVSGTDSEKKTLFKLLQYLTQSQQVPAGIGVTRFECKFPEKPDDDWNFELYLTSLDQMVTEAGNPEGVVSDGVRFKYIAERLLTEGKLLWRALTFTSGVSVDFATKNWQDTVLALGLSMDCGKNEVT